MESENSEEALHVTPGAGRNRENHRKSTGASSKHGGGGIPTPRRSSANTTARLIRKTWRERRISDLCGAAQAHLDFMGKFKSGAAKLRAYNPQIQKDGWESTHTVIEIINDDMPFLVESVTMEVNRQGLTLHLIIQPVMKTPTGRRGRLDRDSTPCSRQGRRF